METCGNCSEASAASIATCQAVNGQWTAKRWLSSATWYEPEDPWTGDSHHSTVIKETTGEINSKYVCLEIDDTDHLARCTGTSEYWSSRCETAFVDLAEDDRTAEFCPQGCKFTPAPTVPKTTTPHAPDIGLPGWNSAMVGACRGGADFTSKVNGKYSNSAGAFGKLSQIECAEACLSEPDCVGYAHSTSWCVVYGPNIHLTPGDGWTGDLHEETTITGSKVNPAYICVTGPPS